MTTATQARITRLAARDGWSCHYCKLPLYNPETVPRRTYDGCRWWEEDGQTICHCGEHGIGEVCGPVVVIGVPLGYGAPQADHVIPKSMGGADDDGNRVLACSACNSGKGARPYETFIRLAAIAGAAT